MEVLFKRVSPELQLIDSAAEPCSAEMESYVRQGASA